MPPVQNPNGPEMAGDQRADDALSACFDSAPLQDPIDVFGTVRATLEVAADQGRSAHKNAAVAQPVPAVQAAADDAAVPAPAVQAAPDDSAAPPAAAL